MKKLVKIAFEYLISLLILGCVSSIIIVYFRGTRGLLTTFDTFLIVMAILTAFMLVVMHLFLQWLGKKRFLNVSIEKIDKMSGEEFELFLKMYFEKQGYKVEMTPRTGDYGADLICKKKDEVIAVQAKRYEGNVGNSAVQEIVAARDFYDADRCIVVTNSYFTKGAIALAEANEVELWDRDFKGFK